MLTHPLRKAVISTGVAARAILFVVLGVIALSLSAPQSANALFSTCDWVDQSINQRADVPGAGGENIFPAVRQWDGSRGLVSGAEPMPKTAKDYTLYEIDGMRGLNWSATQQSQSEAKTGRDGDHADDDECSIQNSITNTVAQAIFDISKFVSRAAISLKEIASNPSPLSALYKHTVEGHDSVVDRLNNRVFKVAVPTMILLTGLWVFGKWRKGDMREVWSGVGWAAFVVIAVSAFLVDNNYTTVVQKADSGIAQGNAALAEAVLSSATGDISPPCALPSGAPQRGMRISTCAMYDTLAFRPWAIGQFGDSGKTPIPYKGDAFKCDLAKTYCDDLRVRQVSAQSLNNFELYPNGQKKIVTDGVMTDKEHQYGEVRYYVAGHEPPDVYETWSGDKPGARVSMGVYALVASLIVGIMVMVLSALTLLWHAVTLIMVILLPLVATIAIHPTQQKLLRGWWQTFVHSFVLRAGFGVILTILLLFYQLILPLPEPLGVQLLMLLLVTIAVVVLLKNLLSGKFTPQVAGAEDALGVADAANSAFGKAAAMPPGVAAGTAKRSGRVVASTAKGAAWTADRVVAKGRGRDKLQQWGWLGQSRREQRQTAQQQSEAAKMVNEEVRERRDAAEQQAPPASPTRGRRVSGSSGQKTLQPTAAQPEPRQPTAPAQSGSAQSGSAQLQKHQPAASRPRPTAAEPPAPRLRPTPTEPPTVPRQPTSPTPPPRDPRGPNGRV
ncbi:hypothetical protein AQI95_02070 [Streptomyces yokosukanensis]|uniref:TrbL/VirB6 plasmid conjugal transfer protein n=1 Tax=Streptomyces yokosukanensis TaxID=67386 RepID=A0A101PFG4_9ACTN|nr:hypothetical protein [Streptomyces yokosukanensis]KUN10520.1 hypothetical protein AQI95_02070 [Streptomyces yokosukanensis]